MKTFYKAWALKLSLEVSVERAACNKTHHVWWLDKVVFGNPCGTPVFLQRFKFLANQVLGPRFLVKVVPRRGRRTLYISI